MSEQTDHEPDGHEPGPLCTPQCQPGLDDPLAGLRKLADKWSSKAAGGEPWAWNAGRYFGDDLRDTLATADEQVAALLLQLAKRKHNHESLLADATQVVRDLNEARAEIADAEACLDAETRERIATIHERDTLRDEVERHRANYNRAMQRAHEAEAEAETLRNTLNAVANTLRKMDSALRNQEARR